MMNGLLDFPIYFNSTKILRPVKWEESSQVVENIIVTEAGTDYTEVTRYDKLIVNAGFGVTDGWAQVFKQFSKYNSFTLKTYDIETKAYKERTVCIRNFTASLRKDSELLSSVNGVWDINYQIKEL